MGAVPLAFSQVSSACCPSAPLARPSLPLPITTSPVMSRTQLFIFIVVIVALTAIPAARAFGAGNVPSFSYMEGKAFRHGDLEDVLTQLIKKSGGLLGRGSKFGGLDVKRIYFGNWLRDYSVRGVAFRGAVTLCPHTDMPVCRPFSLACSKPWILRLWKRCPSRRCSISSWFLALWPMATLLASLR